MENESLKIYWDQEMYSKGKEIWGMEPSNAAKSAIRFINKENLEGKRMLDIGCGYGRDTRYFASLLMNTWGIDFSNEAIKIALQHPYKNTIFAIGDALNIPYSNNYFDFCFCNCVIHWFSYENIKKAICEAYRVLTTDGTAIFCIPEFDNEKIKDCVFFYNGLKYLKDDIFEDFKYFKKINIEKIKEYHSHGGSHEHTIQMVYATK